MKYNEKQIMLLKKYTAYNSPDFPDICKANAYDRMYEKRFENGDYFLFKELKG